MAQIPEHPRPALLLAHRALLAYTFAIALVIGAAVSLTTDTWWFLPLAAGLHALGTTTAAAVAVQMTTTIAVVVFCVIVAVAMPHP